LYDVAWSEIHEAHVAGASGDGSVKLWDVNLKDLPIRAWQEHTRETMSVDWSNLEKERFLSSSWDGSIRIVRGLLNPLTPNEIALILVVCSVIKVDPRATALVDRTRSARRMCISSSLVPARTRHYRVYFCRRRTQDL